MQSEISSRKLQPSMLIPVRAVFERLGPTTNDRLPTVHASSGCDSMSFLFGHRKKSVLKKLTDTPNIQQFLDVMGSPHATQREVISAGLSLLSCIYGGKPSDSLNYLRYASYYQLTTSSTSVVRPERLPPTVNAAKFHVLRAHLQTLQWKTLMSTEASPTDWGWKLHDGHLIPVATDASVAPDNILNVVRCKCHFSSRKPCNTMLCSCRKHGLECVTACKNCHGVDCENVKVHSELFSFSDDDNTDSSPAISADVPIKLNDDSEFFIPWMNEETV